MRIYLLIIMAVLLASANHAQTLTPNMLGFDEYQLEHPENGSFTYYLSQHDGGEQKPLLVYLDGSGPFPLFQYSEDGMLGSTVVLDFQKLMSDYRILLISKPGVPFVDSVAFDHVNGIPDYPEPEHYTTHLSRDWRVQTADMAINHAIMQAGVDKNRIWAMGVSEGGQVAPFLARENTEVDAIMILGGSGLNQMFDPIMTARMQAYAGIITHEQAQQQVDSLFMVYQNIMNNSEDTDKRWWGHTYKRWSGFTSEEIVDVVTELEIPVYVAHGTRDENPVLSVDYLQLEAIRKGKKNLKYVPYAGLDHSFSEFVIEDGSVTNVMPRVEEVVDAALNWVSGL